MKATFKNSSGIKKDMEMGCYGIGISRVMAAIIESTNGHDQDGIIWPIAVAPFRLVIIANPKLMSNAVDIYDRLQHTQLANEVVLDNRPVSIGYKIKDANLIGIPYIAILGRLFEQKGQVEFIFRHPSFKITTSSVVNPKSNLSNDPTKDIEAITTDDLVQMFTSKTVQE